MLTDACQHLKCGTKDLVRPFMRKQGNRKVRFLMITQTGANYTNSTGFVPRPAMDTSLRRLIYGRIRPMRRPGFLARLFHPGRWN